jgi:hypothetical protein
MFGCLIRVRIFFYYELICSTCPARGKVKVIKTTIEKEKYNEFRNVNNNIKAT